MKLDVTRPKYTVTELNNDFRKKKLTHFYL